jgi:hypothetical protein
LKQWGDPNKDGQLFEYCRRFRGVEARPTHPGGTGYVHGLYTFDELNGESRNFLEDVFLLRADDGANVALQRLLKLDLNLGVELRSAWSRFIMTLLYRNPEAIQRLRTKIATELPSARRELTAAWETARREGDPATFEEYATAMPRRDVQQATLMLLHRIMDSEGVGRFLNSMEWGVLTFNRMRYPLLTSDRPYVMTNGLDKPSGHLVMPISPNSVFVAARNIEIMRQLDAESKRKDVCMGEKLNDIVARQSHRFVWGSTATQISFVTKRLGQKQRSMPLE